MKATITASPLNSDDRTVDLTISITSDANVLIQTSTEISVPIDGLSLTMVERRLRDFLHEVRTRNSTLPLTQDQVNTMLLNFVVNEPD
jgi:hypothetical protein